MGLTGATGPTGAQGTQGSPGATGPSGPTGAAGAVGAVAAAAEDGPMTLDAGGPGDRFDMLEETVQACLRMWEGEHGSDIPFSGKHVRIERPLNLPTV